MEVDRLKAFPVGKKEGKKFAFDMATEYLKEAPVKIKYLGGGSFGRAYKVAKKDGESFVVKLSPSFLATLYALPKKTARVL